MSSHLSLAPARAAHVRASGVHVSFGGRPVLAGVDLVQISLRALISSVSRLVEQ